MDDFYAKYIVHEYNAKFQFTIIFGCPCYQQYNDFVKCIFKNRNSYLCCIVLITNDGRSKVVHNCFPIMLGSEIDASIRSISTKDCNLAGSFIINGSYQMLPNFFSNNLGTGHVYRTRPSSKNKGCKKYVLKYRTSGLILILNFNPEPEADHNVIEYSIIDEVYMVNEQTRRRMDYTERMKVFGDDYGPVKIPTTDTNKRKKINRPTGTYHKNLQDRSVNVNWINIMNDNNITKCKSTEEDYIRYFTACLDYAPELDDLANKVCISPGSILQRALKHCIDSCEIPEHRQTDRIINAHTDEKKFRDLSAKIRNVFVNGNMFFTVSTKKVDNIVREYKSMYQAMGGQKLHLISHFTSSTKRYVTEKSRNCAALRYPYGALWFICLVNIREMKGAGETIFLAQWVITSPELPDDTVHNMLQDFHKDDGELIVSWNVFLTNYRMKKRDLAEFKRACPFISLMIFDDYLVVNSKGNQLMKYSVKYQCFITPFESTEIFMDAFEYYPEHLKFSSMAAMLPSSIIRAQQAKAVVAISNIKGRCQTIETPLSCVSFLYNVGTSNAALIHRLDGDSKILKTTLHDSTATPIVIPIDVPNTTDMYAKLAETKGSVESMPDCIKELFKKYKPNVTDQTELYGCSSEDIVPGCSVIYEHMEKLINKWIPNNCMIYIWCDKIRELTMVSNELDNPLFTLNSYCKLSNAIDAKTILDSSVNNNTPILVDKTPLRIMNKDALYVNYYADKIKMNSKARTPPHLALYCAFGDVGGGTNEDGIILDKTFVDNGPQKLISVTLSARFSEKCMASKKNKVINNEVCRVSYLAINKHFSSTIIIGILSSRQPLIVNRSKNLYIVESVVNNHYRYLIYYHDYSSAEKCIESFYTPENSTLLIHFRSFIKLGVGTKLANLHGQKGICSMVTDLKVDKVRDLSKLVGYMADGTRVHPQLLFSPTSIPGRTVSSQIYEMLINSAVGFTEYGQPIAKMSFNVHHIEPACKARVCLVKSDLMTSENGTNANMATNLAQCLTDQGVCDQKNLIHLVIQLEKLNGISMQYLDFDPTTQTNIENKTEIDSTSNDDFNFSEPLSYKTKSDKDFLKSAIDNVIDHFQ